MVAVARIVMASTLVVAALLKVGNPDASRASLSTFGIRGSRASLAALALLVTTELALAAGVVAGLDAAIYAAAGLMLLFAAAIGAALARGKAGAPCACYGARSKLSATSLARNLVLAAGFLALPQIGGDEPSTDGWLAIGLGAALLACAALAVALLALAREVGMLRLQAGSQGALEIAEEGPELGVPSAALAGRLQQGPGVTLGLAVFVSGGCSICRSLEPAIRSLAGEPSLSVGVFDEVADADLWGALEIPGSPFAVAAAPDGTVLAKGTFNNLAQLESVAATGARRWSAGESMFGSEGGVPAHA